MADTHISINEEIEITLKLKVKITHASFYKERTPEQLKHEIESAKKNMEETLYNVIENDDYHGEIGESKWGYVNFRYEVEKSENDGRDV